MSKITLLFLILICFLTNCSCANNRIRVQSVSIGDEYTMIIDVNGGLWACGNNEMGQLGDGTTIDKITPVKVMDGVKAVSSGFYHTLAIKTDGSLWEWGSIFDLKTEKSTKILIPTKIMSNVIAVSEGNGFSMAIKADGSLWAWGVNAFGQLGDGAIYMNGIILENEERYTSKYPVEKVRTAPVKVMDNVKFVSCGVDHTVAIKNDGSLWGWGKIKNPKNSNLGTSVSPFKITDNVLSASSGMDYSIIVKNNGTLWNMLCENGDNSTSAISMTKIMDNVRSASTGGSFTMVIKNDGSLWAWGQNNYGELGDGTIIDKSTPIKIMDHIAFVSTGSASTMAIKNDGSLLAWGNNIKGMLGYGNENNSLIPKRVLIKK